MASKWRDDDSECSDTSLASTQESEPADDYIVECVVARRPDGDGDYEYLVRWEGYPEHRNTWEPVSSFASDQAVKELWRERLQAERRGKTPPFDLDGWERDQYDREAAAERRRAKRRKERARREAAKSKRARLTPKKRKPDTSSEAHRPTEKLSSKRRHVLLDDPSSSDDDIPLVKSTSRQPRSQDTRTDSPVSDLKDSRLSTPSSSLFLHSSDLPLNPPPHPKPRPVANMKPLSQPTSANQYQSGSSNAPSVQRPQPQPTNAPAVQRSQPPPIFQRSKPFQRERNNGPSRPRGPRMQSSGRIQTNAELFRILNGQRNLNERLDLEALNFIDLKTGQDDTATHDALVRQRNLQKQQQQQ
ncbi:hypothetical protein IWX90DRAFT_430427 [Phyllosticta citrichinensis]|uniref:Chromo domain-containing protein n=1 Tax=Phyllosticta citrichinensis TaxID=1130410 RepID=A0ABR1XWG3_9PEZI